MPKKYRCKHLSITAWALAKLQNNKECVLLMHRCKPFLSITARHMYNYNSSMPEMYRCKHLNNNHIHKTKKENKECVPKMYIGANM